MAKDQKTGSFVDLAIKTTKKNPGVGTYEASKGSRVKGTYTFKEQ